LFQFVSMKISDKPNNMNYYYYYWLKKPNKNSVRRMLMNLSNFYWIRIYLNSSGLKAFFPLYFNGLISVLLNWFCLKTTRKFLVNTHQKWTHIFILFLVKLEQFFQILFLPLYHRSIKSKNINTKVWIVVFTFCMFILKIKKPYKNSIDNNKNNNKYKKKINKKQTRFIKF